MLCDGKPIGIMGGTFDPIHYGHLRPALEALEGLGLAEVRFIPCSRPSHRDSPLATPEQRLAMLEQAITGQPGFVADARELRRTGPSYMVDTLASLRTQMGETPLCLLLGADAFNALPRWHRWEKLWTLAHLVVMRRPGASLELSSTLKCSVAQRTVEHPSDLCEQPAGCVLFQPVTQLDISATQIRKLLAAGNSPRYLLPDVILTYIGDQGLYRSPSSPTL